MDYEKEYKKLVGKIDKAYLYAQTDSTKAVLEKIRPELREVGDEEVRKAMIDFFKHEREEGIAVLHYGVSIERMIALLEKRGEQKPADKVEPKFKIGDWIADGILVGKIDEIHELGYHAYFGDHYADVPDIENWHKWTIADAKDGDVLCCESGWTCIFKALDNRTNTFSSYCFMDKDKWFCNRGSEGHTLDERFVKAYNGEISPATKEQRALFFQKMHEAGYEWDAEAQELKKIEQKVAWSEEDEQYLLVCKNALRKYQTTDKWDANIIFCWLENKLKSLTPHSRWKPSSEQMKFLWKYAEQNNYDGRILTSLYNDLKKLKEK